jgi:hypothetical protein
LQIPVLKKFDRSNPGKIEGLKSGIKKNLVISSVADILAATQKSNERLRHTFLDLRGAMEKERGRPRRRRKAAI